MNRPYAFFYSDKWQPLIDAAAAAEDELSQLSLAQSKDRRPALNTHSLALEWIPFKCYRIWLVVDYEV